MERLTALCESQMKEQGNAPCLVVVVDVVRKHCQGLVPRKAGMLVGP